VAKRFRIGVRDRSGAYKQFAIHDRARLSDVGVYLGSAQLSDVPIEGAEAWHAHIIERAGALHLDVIAGDVTHGVRMLSDGDTTPIKPRDVVVIASTTIAIDVERQDGVPDRLITRSNVPNDLFDAERLLRVRVIRGGVREIFELRPFLEARATVSVGSDDDCDVVLPDLPRSTVTLEKGRWNRVAIASLGGDVVVQLCRWPRHAEPIRRLWQPPPPRPEPPPPPPPPPPPTPIDLGVALRADRCIAALVACMRARPPRSRPPRALLHALETYTFAPPLAELFVAWAQHQVGRIEIGALAIGDGFLERTLPVMIKGELYGEVDVDHSQVRTDVLVIGRHRHRTLVFRRGSTIDDSPIEVDTGAGTESWGGTLGRIVCDAMQEAHASGIATDLDPYYVRAV
jgi:hypothetical protein